MEGLLPRRSYGGGGGGGSVCKWREEERKRELEKGQGREIGKEHSINITVTHRIILNLGTINHLL